MTLEQARTILKEVAAEYGLATELLRSRSRRADIAEARSCAIRRIYKETNLKMVSIARLFDLHHSTVSDHVNGKIGVGARAAATSGERAD